MIINLGSKDRGPGHLGLRGRAPKLHPCCNWATHLLSNLNNELLLESSVREKFPQLSLETTRVDEGAPAMALAGELL